MLESNIGKISLEELEIEPAEDRCEDHVEFGVGEASDEISLLVTMQNNMHVGFAE